MLLNFKFDHIVIYNSNFKYVQRKRFRINAIKILRYNVTTLQR